ncbi:MAG: hypothetical protein AAGI09_05115 [Pseudomonadota bacterium]
MRSAELAQQALALVDQQTSHDALARCSALRTLGWQAKWRGDFEQTTSYCLQAKQGMDRLVAKHLLVDVFSLLGVVHYSAGRRDFASRMVRRGFDLVDDTIPDEALVDLYTTQSTIQRYRGRIEESRHALENALELAKGAERARVEHNIARTMNYEYKYVQAAERAEESLALARQYKNRIILPYTLEVLSAAYIALDRPVDALPHLEEGLEIAQTDRDQRAACQLLHQLGIAQRKRGEMRHASEALIEGQRIAQSIGYPIWLTRFTEARAQLYEAEGEFQKAASAYKEVVRLKDSMRD